MPKILPDFVPAKPTPWFISAAQAIVQAELALSNRLQLAEADLDIFRRLPKGAGVILASNHADETDPLVCLELSRRSRMRFISMCNREAFDENYGLAGLVLQRLGHFSVKRGTHDNLAKDYAIKTVQQGNDVLVIFPEGEIFYLNENVQPFHTGAVEICLQAIVEKRKADPNWTAFILPMVIKYHYNQNIEKELDKRLADMESRLMLKTSGKALVERLHAIQETLVEREERSYSLAIDNKSDLAQKLQLTKESILSAVEKKHQDLNVSAQGQTLDQVWQLEAELKELIDKQTNTSGRQEIEQDLASLAEAAQLASWRPSYYPANASYDRLAEGILKAERELYRIKRPRQLASRQVLVKLAEPINMGEHVGNYIQDPHAVRHNLTEQLHEQIQALISLLTASLPPGK